LDVLIDLEAPKVQVFKTWKKARIGKEFLRYKFGKELSPFAKKYARTAVVWGGFIDGLIEMMYSLNKIYKLDVVPDFSKKRESKAWEGDLRYSTYIEEVAPDLKTFLEKGYGNLLFWVREAQRVTDGKIRLLTAENDFLNAQDLTASYDLEELGPEHLLIIPVGGHLGYMGHPWYRKFMEIHFPSLN
jgi:hypothetical protein